MTTKKKPTTKQVTEKVAKPTIKSLQQEQVNLTEQLTYANSKVLGLSKDVENLEGLCNYYKKLYDEAVEDAVKLQEQLDDTFFVKVYKFVAKLFGKDV